MVTATQSLTVILMSVLLSTKIAVNGVKPPCRPNAIVNLTGEKPDSSGSVHKSGFVFPPEAMWAVNDTGLFGCPCYYLQCNPLCCPVGYVLGPNGCLRNNGTLRVPRHRKNGQKWYAFFDDDCMWKTNVSVEKNFVISPSGQMISLSGGATVDLGDYCLFRLADSPEVSAVVCAGNYSNEQISLPISLAISSLNVSMLFALATFVVYSLIPELKNLQGSILRSYLASHIICIIFLTVVLSSNILESTYFYLSIIVTAADYFGIACLMWLNVMSFDIWRKFRRIQSSPVVNMKKCQKATFIRYSVYVWFGSVVPPSISHLYSMLEGTRQGWLWWYLMLWPLAVIPFCNICLFSTTALKIKQRQKDITNLVGGVNKHHQENKQWFNLYVKLFLIMGCPLVFWAIAFYWMNPLFFDFVCMLEALQGISIFYTFIWKDDIRRLLRKQYEEMLLSISGFFRRCRSTPGMEN